MNKFFAHAALAAAALLSVGAANAYVIDFENVDTSTLFFPPQLTDWESVQQGSFTIGAYNPNNPDLSAAPDGTLVGALVDGSDAAQCLGRCPGGNATTYLASVDDSFVYLWDGGSGMKMSSFDAAYLGPVEADTAAAFLVIEADHSDGSVTAGAFSLTINDDGTTPFSHFLTSDASMLTPGDLTSGNNITHLFAYTYYCETGQTCTLAATNKGQFALDNISITSVPEPSSWLLMGLGLVGIAAQVRRRRSI